MNDELSKAVDAAMADAAEMGTLEVGKPNGVGNDFCCNVRIGGGWDIAVFATTESEALRRARLIERAVNGMGLQAARIAELEAAFEEMPSVALSFAREEDVNAWRAWRNRVFDNKGNLRQSLSSKGGA